MTRPATRAAATALAAAVCVAAAGCGGSTSSDKAKVGAATVSMRDLKFHPETLKAKVGRPVTWRNDDDVDHNVTATSGAKFHSKAFGKGKTYRFKPTKAGTIAYVCTLHPGMKGRLTVTD
jgi:plastocyanin